jgi:predicted nucleic acid-binding protein
MICVDASVAVKWIVEEEHTDRALALYFDASRADEVIVVPSLLPIEVTNILRKKMRQEGLTRERATALLDLFLNFSIAIYNPVGLYRQALVLADTYSLPAIYDAHYLALAQRLDCDLWTDDRKLTQINLPFVRRIGDYPL